MESEIIKAKRPLDVENRKLQKETGVKQVDSMNRAFDDSMKMPDIQVNFNKTGVEGRAPAMSGKPLRKELTPKMEMAEANKNAKAKQARNRLIR